MRAISEADTNETIMAARRYSGRNIHQVNNALGCLTGFIAVQKKTGKSYEGDIKGCCARLKEALKK
jgi:hypothetical protein